MQKRAFRGGFQAVFNHFCVLNFGSRMSTKKRKTSPVTRNKYNFYSIWKHVFVIFRKKLAAVQYSRFALKTCQKFSFSRKELQLAGCLRTFFSFLWLKDGVLSCRVVVATNFSKGRCRCSSIDLSRKHLENCQKFPINGKSFQLPRCLETFICLLQPQ